MWAVRRIFQFVILSSSILLFSFDDVLLILLGTVTSLLEINKWNFIIILILTLMIQFLKKNVLAMSCLHNQYTTTEAISINVVMS